MKKIKKLEYETRDEFGVTYLNTRDIVEKLNEVIEALNLLIDNKDKK